MKQNKMFRPMNGKEIENVAKIQGKAVAEIITRLLAMSNQNLQTIEDGKMNGLGKNGAEDLLSINAQYRRAIGSLTGAFTMDAEDIK